MDICHNQIVLQETLEPVDGRCISLSWTPSPWIEHHEKRVHYGRHPSSEVRITVIRADYSHRLSMLSPRHPSLWSVSRSELISSRLRALPSRAFAAWVFVSCFYIMQRDVESSVNQYKKSTIIFRFSTCPFWAAFWPKFRYKIIPRPIWPLSISGGV